MRYLIVVFLGFSFFGFSQLQVSESGGVIYNNYLENVADVSPENIEIGVVGGIQKNQLLKNESQTFFINTPIRHKQIGVGLAIANRKSSISKDQEVRVSGNYNLLIAGDTLSFGMGMQFKQQEYSLEGLYVNDATDEVVLQSNLSNRYVDFSTGIVFSPNKYRFSLSVKNLMNYKTSTANFSWWSFWGLRSFNVNETYVLQGGVKVEQFTSRPILYTLFLNNQVGNALSVGFGYKTNKSIFFQMAIKVNSLLKVYDPVLFGYEYINNVSSEVLYNLSLIHI